jgi:serine carboxypeptidase 1
VDDNKYLSTDNKQIALDLVSLLKEVYVKLPEFKSTPLHIFGESYGGKMAIEFAYELNKAVERREIEANLQGAYLGDAWISPIESTMSWAPYLFQLVIQKIIPFDVKFFYSISRYHLRVL